MAITDNKIDAIQTAILWSGSALIIGTLLGFGLGVSICREIYGEKKR